MWRSHGWTAAEGLSGSTSEAGLSQVLIATSTLAWGVNFPAHLVVVKGTEYYDGKSRRYVDYPITGAQTQRSGCYMVLCCRTET